ncbi:MAG TPA: hypothetical protein ENL34_10220 [Chloroflexi bacterium]|nr:hypothetical protein [Chloroflexota bacterium]
MTWPIDALLRTYTSKMQIPSADLNNFQQRIVDLHAPRIIPVTRALIKDYVTGGTDVALQWQYDTADLTLGWTCRSNADPIIFPIPIVDGAVLATVYVKVYNSAAATLTAHAYEIDHKVEAATTVPAKSASLANDAAAGATAWDTMVLSIDQVMAAYRQIVIEVDAATVNDRVAAVYAAYQPITPTP